MEDLPTTSVMISTETLKERVVYFRLLSVYYRLLTVKSSLDRVLWLTLPSLRYRVNNVFIAYFEIVFCILFNTIDSCCVVVILNMNVIRGCLVYAE